MVIPGLVMLQASVLAVSQLAFKVQAIVFIVRFCSLKDISIVTFMHVSYDPLGKLKVSQSVIFILFAEVHMVSGGSEAHW